MLAPGWLLASGRLPAPTSVRTQTVFIPARLVLQVSVPEKALERARHVSEWLHGCDPRVLKPTEVAPRSGGHAVFIAWLLAEELKR